MEGKYIFALIILGIFLLLILISLAFLELKRKSESRLQAWIEERYADNSLNKFNYDTVSAEEEIEEQNISEEASVEVIAPEEVAKQNEEPEIPVPDSYGKIEVEGIEEITGNYNGK